ncbi:MAG: hypothetical protein D6768_03040 [Chloroflexi bacterium]|nr:MAG: hypothetical protein D6768_03040 [Chloroflexota bacterium]
MLNHYSQPTAHVTDTHSTDEPADHSKMVSRLMVLVVVAAFIKLLYLYLEKERETISERLWLTEDRTAIV